MLRVVTYHRIDDPHRTPLLDPKLISATPEVFEQHIRFLAKNYDVVAMADVLAAVEHGHALPKRALLITFDDAYCDFKEFAWPCLKHHTLPATVFVPTAYPDDEQRMFWWDRLYSVVKSTSVAQLNLAPVGTIALTTNEAKERAIRQLQHHVKLLPHTAAMKFVDDVCAALGNGVHPGKTVLGWDELRALVREGVTLGPHTQTHPLMTRLTREQLQREILGAHQDMARELGEVLPIFCYPNGSHNDDVVDMLRQEGFTLAFTVVDGHNDLRSDDLLRLHRTNITRKSSLPVLRIRLQRWFTYIDRWRHRKQKSEPTLTPNAPTGMTEFS